MNKKGLFMAKNLPVILSIFLFINTGCRYEKPDLVPVTCDTTLVIFSGSVMPILNLHCISCHSGPNAPLGIKLDNHAGVKAVAVNGKLLGAITHSPGFSPMPQNANKLSDCNIDKIRKWIATGAPNN